MHQLQGYVLFTRSSSRKMIWLVPIQYFNRMDLDLQTFLRALVFLFKGMYNFRSDTLFILTFAELEPAGIPATQVRFHLSSREHSPITCCGNSH